MNKDYKENVEKAWCSFLNVTTHEGLYFPDVDGISKEYKHLCDVVFSNKKVKKYFSAEDLLNYLRDWCLDKIERDQNFEWNSKISDHLNEDEISSGADSLITMLEGLPIDYTMLFPMHDDIPEEIDRVEILENVEVISSSTLKKDYNIDNASSFTSLISPFVQAPINAKSYLCITVSGYIRTFGGGETAVKAEKLLRRILFLYKLSGNAEITSYKHPDRPVECLYFPVLDIKKISSFSVTQSTLYGLLNFSFKSQIWEPSAILPPKGSLKPTLLGLNNIKPEKGHERYSEAIKTGFSERATWISKFLMIEDNEKRNLLRAIDWAYIGELNQDEDSGFIQICIALESLLAGEEQNINSDRMADRAAYMLGKTKKERLDIKKKFKKIYELRSKIVHGENVMGAEDRGLLYDASFLLDRILRNEINSFLKENS